ncbi:tRNA pseudouridine(13) synthase TruD [Helicobacter sp. T3_23-1059]
MPNIFSYQNLRADFHFAHSQRDFVVNEIPLYDFSGNGEHQILQIRKKGLSTFELVKILSTHFACPSKSIGYAGLKDKNATTTQYLSIPKIYLKNKNIESSFEAISKKHEIKLISTTLHNNKIKLGHLKGNRFFVRLKKVTPINAKKIQSSLKIMEQSGFANFFGFQRFGINGENYKLGFALDNKQNHNDLTIDFKDNVSQNKAPKNKKMQNFLRSSLQSYLFNEWLCVRLLLGRFGDFGFADFINAINLSAKHNMTKSSTKSNPLDSHTLQSKAFANLANLSKNDLGKIYKALQSQKMPFKLLDGDICSHYPHGRFFCIEKLDFSEVARFETNEISPTGALQGENLKTSKHIAHLCESPFLEIATKSSGARRYAWVWAKECESIYKDGEAQMELHFSLPSGAYATTMIEQIAGKSLTKI